MKAINLQAQHRIWTAAQLTLVLSKTRDPGIKEGDSRLSGKIMKFPTTLLLSPKAYSKAN